MRIAYKYPKFYEIDFVRLYCAMNVKKRCLPVINHHELEKRLYEFYNLPEFRELFQDICPKIDHINPKNSYLDIETALQTAQLLGLITLIHDSGSEIRSIISCDEKTAQKIIENSDIKMVEKMTKLFNVMFKLDNNLTNQEEAQSLKLVKKSENY